MSAVIRRFVVPSERLTEAEAALFRPYLVDLAASPDHRLVVRRMAEGLLGELDRDTASRNRWSFVMLSPSQHGVVVEHLAANSRRPVAALRLWALCFEHLRMDTGEVLLSRGGFAERLGLEPRTVSELVSELVRFGALSRLREGRGVRYFMNPLVGTHLKGAARDEAQRAAPKLALVAGGDRKGERRARCAFPPVAVL